jgi:hypothetical protein
LARRFVRRDREQPKDNFVIDTDGISLRPATPVVTGSPGQVLEVSVDVVNGSPWWLSSGFRYPISASYRWLDVHGAPVAIEGRRTHFPEPVAPGASARVAVAVELPAEPGQYTLVLTLVQEHFAWLDEIDPACTARLAAVVSVDSV